MEINVGCGLKGQNDSEVPGSKNEMLSKIDLHHLSEGGI